MNKKQWTALMSALVLTTSIGLAAFNAQAETPTFDPQPLLDTVSGDREQDEDQLSQALIDQVVLTKADAEQLFLDHNPGCTIKEIELDEEDGVPVYEVEGVDANGAEVEMEINAIDGTVMLEDQDDRDGDERDERDESEHDDMDVADYTA